MRTYSSLLFLLMLLAQGAALSPCAAQEEETAVEAGPPPTVRARLEAIRDDLIQLKLEKALSNIEILLEDPGLTAADRTEAWILRSQAHVAFGDIDGAEEDYREILRQRPAFRPEGSLTTPKAMERFESVKAAMVGTLKVDLRPADARLMVDGKEVVIAGDGTLDILAGERLLRAERRGYDIFEEMITLAPGVESPFSLMMIPNARTVVIRTVPEDVSVSVDGEIIGLTRLPDVERVPGSDQIPAGIVLEDIPLGEHIFELNKACYRTVRLNELLTVDIMDPVPLELDTFYMEPSRASMALRGTPVGAGVFVDGRRVGKLPLEANDLCPGLRDLEVRVNDHVVFREVREATEGSLVEVDVRPRPNIVLVGGQGVYPRGFENFAAGVNTISSLPLPAGWQDLSTPAGWQSLSFPQDTHLALAALPPVEEHGSEQWYLYSTLLRVVERLNHPPADAGAQSWSVNLLGMTVIDSETGGPARVVDVRDGGPAAQAGIRIGDTVLSINGNPVETATATREQIAETVPGSVVQVEVQPIQGERAVLEVAGKASPWLATAAERNGSPALLAAWAEQEAIAYPDKSAAPLANLAMMMSEAGRDALAAETWLRVRWGDRTGIGEGTTAYYLGRVLTRLGREEEAVEAFTKAARSSATAVSDEGPVLTGAATDHLTDLGISAGAN